MTIPTEFVPPENCTETIGCYMGNIGTFAEMGTSFRDPSECGVYWDDHQGEYHCGGFKHPRPQILSVADMLAKMEGKSPLAYDNYELWILSGTPYDGPIRWTIRPDD